MRRNFGTQIVPKSIGLFGVNRPGTSSRRPVKTRVIEPKFSKRKGKAEKKGKGKGRGGAKEKAKARPKAKAKAEAKAKSASSSARSAARPAPHPTGLTQPQALRILDLPADGFAELREEGINKAYRKLALKWHPDRPCNRLKKEEPPAKMQSALCADHANAKFLELRNAFELMRDVLKAKKALQDLGQEGMMRGVNAHEAMVIIVMLMMVLAVKGCQAGATLCRADHTRARLGLLGLRNSRDPSRSSGFGGFLSNERDMPSDSRRMAQRRRGC
eukprot:g16603.t1